MVRASSPNRGRKLLKVGGGSEELAREVTRLLALDAAALQQRWVAIFGADSSLRLGRRLMIRALAYRLQEGALAGLKPSTLRILDRVANGRATVGLQPARKQRASAGTVLIREWRGVSHRVTVLLVDTMVVYKVDRLTRSLTDFARMVELFDAKGVSFVAVTQQFNTTTSMGRLTLNVLLSFAQFEREVIGERIRDKVAASKRKGIWMGGVLPLGYDVRERKLVVNHDEAQTVRGIFERYLELGSVRLLGNDLRQRGIVSSAKVSRNGNARGGKQFSRGALYHLLSNPIYLGEIRHKQERHPGQHEEYRQR
jgi:DNA invertase Pin-like site-specific DNA recombinase